MRCSAFGLSVWTGCDDGGPAGAAGRAAASVPRSRPAPAPHPHSSLLPQPSQSHYRSLANTRSSPPRGPGSPGPATPGTQRPPAPDQALTGLWPSDLRSASSYSAPTIESLSRTPEFCPFCTCLLTWYSAMQICLPKYATDRIKNLISSSPYFVNWVYWLGRKNSLWSCRPTKMS